MSNVPSMNTINVLTERNLKEEPPTKSELDDIIKYYRWLRGQADEKAEAKTSDLPKKDPKAKLQELGLLKAKPKEEVRRA